MKKKMKELKEKGRVAAEQRQYEMLTIFCYIALDSPESAAKRVVLIKDMSDAFSKDSPVHRKRRLDCRFKEGGQSSRCEKQVL